MYPNSLGSFQSEFECDYTINRTSFNIKILGKSYITPFWYIKDLSENFKRKNKLSFAQLFNLVWLFHLIRTKLQMVRLGKISSRILPDFWSALRMVSPNSNLLSYWPKEPKLGINSKFKCIRFSIRAIFISLASSIEIDTIQDFCASWAWNHVCTS